MSNIDCVISWPQHLDYPLWRKFIHENRSKFNKVIVIFTQMNTKGDYREFVKETMAKDDITFDNNNPVSASEDWRDVAVNKGLAYSTSKWVLFTEQDFLPSEGFWEEVSSLKKVLGIVAFGAWVERRLHPCCIFAKRSEIEKTSKYFGVIKDKLDHFGKFQQDLIDLGPVLVIPESTYSHMNGLSQNLHMLQTGEEPNYRPNEFKEYCKRCLELSLHPDFEKLFKEYLVL